MRTSAGPLPSTALKPSSERFVFSDLLSSFRRSKTAAHYRLRRPTGGRHPSQAKHPALRSRTLSLHQKTTLRYAALRRDRYPRRPARGARTSHRGRLLRAAFISTEPTNRSDQTIQRHHQELCKRAPPPELCGYAHQACFRMFLIFEPSDITARNLKVGRWLRNDAVHTPRYSNPADGPKARGVLLFTSPECGPCTDLLPEIGRWHEEHS